MTPPKIILIFGVYLIQIICTHAQVIPAHRITDWDSPGSEPAFQIEESVVLSDYGADPTGVMPSDMALLQAINALNGPGEVIIPHGTYLFEETIELPDSIVIRGAEDTLASIPLVKFKLSPGENNHGISIRGSSINTNITIFYPLLQGDQLLYVDQPELFAAGEFIHLVPFDDSLLVNDPWAYNSTGQIFQILEINGDSLILNKPLRRSYSLTHPPMIYKLIPRRQVHIKCISIERLDQTTTQTSTIYFRYAADCSVNGIESHFSNYAHIDIVTSTRITVENSFFKDAHDYASGGKGYGVMLESTTGDCYIHQNNFAHLRHAMIMQSGANGNVLAYNYSTDPFWTGTALPSNASGDLVLHGNYVYMNLMEGNTVQNIVIDNSHDINGPYNTFFRNRAELYGIFMNNNPASDRQNFIGNQVTNTSSLFLGLYLLQGSDHFEYGNQVKGIVMPAGTQEPDEASMFNYVFPSFYQTVSTTPPIRHDNWQDQAPLIEAAYRYQVSDLKAVCDDIVYMPSSISGAEGADVKDFDAYPNPFDDGFYIRNSSGELSYVVKIFDSTGRNIFSAPVKGETNFILLPGLNPGIYFVHIEGEEHVVIKMLKH